MHIHALRPQLQKGQLLKGLSINDITFWVTYFSQEDDEYWARILKWNRHSDVALLAFLEINQKFWFLSQEGISGTDESSTQWVLFELVN